MKNLLAMFLLVCGLSISAQTTQNILSPNLKLMVDLGGDQLRFSISNGQGEVMDLSEAYMEHTRTFTGAPIYD